MSPFLKPDDEVEFEPGRPIPNGRICLAKIGSKKRVRQVFQEGEYYRLKPLNINWSQQTEFVHVEKAETFVIVEKCRDWLNERIHTFKNDRIKVLKNVVEDYKRQNNF